MASRATTSGRSRSRRTRRTGSRAGTTPRPATTSRTPTSWPTGWRRWRGWPTRRSSTCIPGPAGRPTTGARPTRSSTSTRGAKTTWDEVLVLARLYRTALEHLGVRGFPKVTGKRGIQVWVPIEPRYTFDETRDWVGGLSRAVGAIVPDLVCWDWAKTDRGGKARLDFTQNALNKTLVAPYAVRPVRHRRGLRAHHLGGAGRRRPCAPTAGTSARSWSGSRSVGDLFRGALGVPTRCCRRCPERGDRGPGVDVVRQIAYPVTRQSGGASPRDDGTIPFAARPGASSRSTACRPARRQHRSASRPSPRPRRPRRLDGARRHRPRVCQGRADAQEPRPAHAEHRQPGLPALVDGATPDSSPRTRATWGFGYPPTTAQGYEGAMACGGRSGPGLRARGGRLDPERRVRAGVRAGTQAVRLATWPRSPSARSAPRRRLQRLVLRLAPGHPGAAVPSRHAADRAPDRRPPQCADQPHPGRDHHRGPQGLQARRRARHDELRRSSRTSSSRPSEPPGLQRQRGRAPGAPERADRRPGRGRPDRALHARRGAETSTPRRCRRPSWASSTSSPRRTRWASCSRRAAP